VPRCPRSRSGPSPAPLPPVRLALLAPTHGYRGLPGRTLDAVTLTLRDFGRQVLLQLAGAGSPGEALLALPTLRSGGVRAGWAQFENGALTFHDYAYVAGVTLSGAIRPERADLRIGGSAGAHGTLRLGAHDALVGTLGGHAVRVNPNPGGTAAIVEGDAQASFNFAAGNPAARAAADELDRLIGRFL